MSLPMRPLPGEDPGEGVVSHLCEKCGSSVFWRKNAESNHCSHCQHWTERIGMDGGSWFIFTVGIIAFSLAVIPLTAAAYAFKGIKMLFAKKNWTWREAFEQAHKDNQGEY